MDITQENQQLLANYLLKTLVPNERLQAEQFLTSVERNPQFSLLLLSTCSSGALVDNNAKFLAAVYFKNFVKRLWGSDSENVLIPVEDQVKVKELIMDVLVTSHFKIQLQLCEAVNLIAKSDFPAQWPNLIVKIVELMASDNFDVLYGALLAVHSIIKPWREMFRSDELFSEIKYVLTHFCNPFLELIKRTDATIKSLPTDSLSLSTLFNCFILQVKIYYSLNCQDLPEFFEDHMAEFMAIFHQYLLYTNPMFDTKDDSEPGVLENLKASICHVINLYVKKYEEEFIMLPQFAETIWSLLASISIKQKYDELACQAMEFLAVILKSPRHRVLFEKEGVLPTIATNVVLPNLTLRETDVDLVEDDPLEFIRRDIEGSDSDTRKKAALDLTQAMLAANEKLTIGTLSQYVETYLKRHATGGATYDYIQDKNVANSLFSTLATVSYTKQHGVTKVREGFPVVEYFTNNLESDLKSNIPSLILKVDAVRYIIEFRHHFPKPLLIQIICDLTDLLEGKDLAITVYASVALTKLLAQKNENNQHLFTPTELATLLPRLMEKTINVLCKESQAEKLSENHYTMRLLLRTIMSSREAIKPFLGTILPALVHIISIIYKNPSNPKYNVYIFECISFLIKYGGGNDEETITQLENYLFPTFQAILQENVTEFMPFVFQLMALLLLQRPTPGLPEAYQSMLPPMLQPTLWENRGNIAGLTAFLKACLEKGAELIVQNQQLGAVLGIFQRLINSKLYDLQGFRLLENLVERVPIAALGSYLKPIFSVLLTRLQNNKTPRFVKRLVYFIFFCLKCPGYDEKLIFATLDELQPGLSVNFTRAVLIPEMANLTSLTKKETKICKIGLCGLMFKSSLLPDELWPAALDAMAQLFSSSGVEEKIVDDEYLEELEEVGYQASYTELLALSTVTTSAVAGDENELLRKCVREFYIHHQEKFKILLGSTSESTQVFFFSILK